MLERHEVFLLVAAALIVGGSLIASPAQATTCTYTCQRSVTSSAKNTTCMPADIVDGKPIKDLHDEYQMRKKSDNPADQRRAEQIYNQIQQCAENLNACIEGGALFPLGAANTCDKSKDGGEIPKGALAQQPSPDTQAQKPGGGGAQPAPSMLESLAKQAEQMKSGLEEFSKQFSGGDTKPTTMDERYLPKTPAQTEAFLKAIADDFKMDLATEGVSASDAQRAAKNLTDEIRQDLKSGRATLRDVAAFDFKDAAEQVQKSFASQQPTYDEKFSFGGPADTFGTPENPQKPQSFYEKMIETFGRNGCLSSGGCPEIKQPTFSSRVEKFNNDELSRVVGGASLYD